MENADETTICDAEKQITALTASNKQLRIEETQVTELLGNLRAKRDQANECAEARRRKRDEAECNWQPAQERWHLLESLAGERRVLDSAMTRRFVDTLAGRGSATLWSDARARAAELKERLAHARDSKQVLEVVTGLLGSQELSGEACLGAWSEVRHWLQRRIPAQIADVDEPLEALGRLPATWRY